MYIYSLALLMTFKILSMSTDLPDGQSLAGLDAKYIPVVYVVLMVIFAGVSKR